MCQCAGVQVPRRPGIRISASPHLRISECPRVPVSQCPSVRVYECPSAGLVLGCRRCRASLRGHRPCSCNGMPLQDPFCNDVSLQKGSGNGMPLQRHCSIIAGCTCNDASLKVIAAAMTRRCRMEHCNGATAWFLRGRDLAARRGVAR